MIPIAATYREEFERVFDASTGSCLRKNLRPFCTKYRLFIELVTAISMPAVPDANEEEDEICRLEEIAAIYAPARVCYERIRQTVI